ncbi:PREDICTED: leucine-rich repeat flightless-interacting protein 2 isoform X2 [Mandrillus leucophaeus]|uniref:Leucine-rich repeat flightless-interacting protein 2 n=3 Tax=Cercopithecidae TaxID=9527 RepID=A0A2K6AHK5_MANLE|nr:PREDICTED: leucine-rich repeat flightless-interacting protein 2 isoform X2 [Colobus angolensis palliatus]XP_011837318.1 PREDICTED: leucine-rich repeat flightless-interacting protein 2 isoform X2 [Mandrillus leucophaeus]XP_025231822.1 leucine-rich repeat flightless-interacting protein 2 isoform X3 [Theropithecus gelada]
MGTPGSGRKRTPVKDRFSAEDEALSNIAREAEARLAAKRAARAEARDIRMRELERQQKEEDSERARYSHRSSHHRPYLGVEDALSIRSLGSHRNHSYSHSHGMKKRSSGSHKDPLASLYNGGLYNPYGSRTLDEKSDKQYAENYTRPSSRNSASATTPLSGNSSRRGSGDTSSLIDPDTSLSELRESLSEVEEKYKKAMVSNAQLDNEKNNLIYQVDTLKDVIEEQEEQMAEFYRENEEKSKELERQKHMCSVLQHKMEELKEGLRQRDELIEEKQRMQQKIDTMTKEVFDLQETLLWKDKKIGKHGLVIIPDGTPNGDVSHEPVAGAITVVSQEAAQVLESAGEGPLDVRLRKLAGEKEELLSQIRKLKLQLEEERQKCSRNDGTVGDLAGLQNGSDLQFIEMQRDANRQISEYKFKLSKAEQDITTLEQSISRLEGQVLRYKTAAENAEKVEDELKAEKRKLQRELRTALDKIEEMEMTNSHLAKRLEKMKANRTALLAQQ